MLKDDVIKLISRESDYISGEAISRKLGVTRAAVNSAVKALRDEGYEITSSTNKGYLLTKSPDILTKGSVSVFLPDALIPKVHVFDSVDSTNNVLKDMARNGAPSGTVVIADHQTGGKGRRGRSFSSPKASECISRTCSNRNQALIRSQISPAGQLSLCLMRYTMPMG